MKLKLFVLAIAAAALSASVALAGPPHAPKTPKPHPTPPACKPNVQVELKGTVAVAPGATPVLPFGLMVTVKHGDKHGKAYVKATQPVTITVTTDTKFDGGKRPTLASLLVGDRITIHSVGVCKSALAHGATPALTAKHIDAHPAKPAH